MESFAEGFLFGLGAAIPLGPINILIMSNALKNYRSAVALGVGAMSADTIYLLLILLGLATFMEYPSVMMTLGLFGSAFLLYMSYSIYKGRKTQLLVSGDTKIAILPNYLKGLSLTLLNPYTVIFWLSVSTYIQTKELDITLTILGMFSAIAAWITVMPYIIHKTKHMLSSRVAEVISIVSSAILSFFALGMLYKLFTQ